ncbi:metal ABC transporter permease [Schlesneria paludicola]|uniref:metal ABC transporter permease n=1 Tax=Schlesneria paludicola TaxID=360056 RepID=UPI00029B2CA6|nr:iron chelate uptake ABC transporter family permease subunit [Schlesneria paludicola]
MSDTLLLASSIAYNTRIVLLGTMLLGMCGGIVGAFMLLRKKALVGDVASHAALPGVGIAYLVGEAITPGSGKSLPWLLVGASITAGLGVVTANLIQRTRLIKEDAALGIVLSLFFGAGIVLLTIIQSLSTGSAAGLSDFIFGKTAAMTLMDVNLIASASAIVLVICCALFKEFSLICFDEEYAAVLGWPAKRLDLLLTVLVVGVTVIGMQSVGLLLVVALLVIPPSAARFWSDRLGPMVIIASAIGGISASIGVMLSASFENLAAGPIIVLTGTVIFSISLLFGIRRGTVWNVWRRRIASRRKGQLDLLRACYEQLEQQIAASGTLGLPIDRSTIDLTPYPISRDSLIAARSWSTRRVDALLRSSVQEGWLRHDSEGQFRLTQEGARLAAKAVRNHRLWELYLIHYADVALGRVDREADLIEHVLEPVIVEQLETLLKHDRSSSIPTSPHD